MAEITLASLIKEQKARIPTLRSCKEFPYYQYDDWEDYQKWVAKTIRFLNINYPNDKFVIDFEKMSGNVLVPTQQNALLVILEAIADLPTIVPQNNKKRVGKGVNITTTINNTNNQSQSQEQFIAVNIFLEAIKDDLTGRQVKELKEVIVESGGDKEKARDSIIAKLKSFGLDVASNIVANIITSPLIWSSL